MLIAVVVGIIAVIGSLLPRSYDFSTTTVINAPPEIVFENVNTIKTWQDWSQWSPQQVADLEVEYSGTESGVGAAQAWTDPRGDGKLWIVESVPGQKVAYKLEFAGFPEMASSIDLSVVEEPADVKGQTRVVWSSRGTLPGGPFYGFFSPFFATGMQHQYDASLLRLKALVESQSTDERGATASDSPADAAPAQP